MAMNPQKRLRTLLATLILAEAACLLVPASSPGQAQKLPNTPPVPERPAGPTLRLDKTRFAPGEEIRVFFTAPPEYATDAWVGLVPSEIPHGDEVVNDRHVGHYEYLRSRAAGVLTFQAPARPGNWDLRMNDTDQQGREVASFGFTVEERRPRGAFAPALRLAKMFYAPGEEIVISFTAPAAYPENAWIGILPSTVPHGDEAVNDSFDVCYQYLEGRTTGTIRLVAPTQPGRWDVRMHDTDSNGREVASLTFAVLSGR
jgi:hypothetical protein